MPLTCWNSGANSNTEVGQDGILRAVVNRAERPIDNRLQVANLPHIKTELA